MASGDPVTVPQRRRKNNFQCDSFFSFLAQIWFYRLPRAGIIVARLVLLAKHRDQIMLLATNPKKLSMKIIRGACCTAFEKTRGVSPAPTR
jgi:hypothetical protein